MKRRYYLVLFVIFFGLATWGIFHLLEGTISLPNAAMAPAHNDLQPETPAAAPQAPVQSDVVVTNPSEGQHIISPLLVTGQARGSWFFEGSFPMALINDQGAVIASGAAKAQGNWMTSDYVSFTGTLAFLNFNNTSSGHYNNGFLILKKDNPSGDPQFDKSVSIKVQY